MDRIQIYRQFTKGEIINSWIYRKLMTINKDSILDNFYLKSSHDRYIPDFETLQNLDGG